MTNGELMKKLISEKGFTLAGFARILGISRQGLNNKLTNKREFKQSEIQKAIEVLALTKEQSDDIFFTVHVGFKSLHTYNQKGA